MSTFKPGNTLMKLDEPLAHCLLIEYKEKLCDYCFFNKNLKQCSFCKIMHYCSTTCQRADWNIHKQECPRFKQLNDKNTICVIDDDLVRIFIRFLIRKNQSITEDNLGLRNFETLVDHYDEILKDSFRMNKAHKCLEKIKFVMGFEFIEKFKTKDLISYFGKLVINTFSISNNDMSETVGSGLYLSLSSIDHSCNPNCVVIFNGIKASIKVINEFETIQKAFISYTEILSTKNTRQKYLQKNYYFKCKCPRCEDLDEIDKKMVKLKCSSCDDNCFNLDEENLEPKCESCETSNQTEINKANLLINEINNFLENSSKQLNIKNSMQRLVNKSKDIFSFSEMATYCENVYLVKLYEVFMDFYIQENQLAEANEIAIRVLKNAYMLYLPKNHPTMGLLYTKIAKISINLENWQIARQFYQKADEILRITHDSDHPLFNELTQIYYQL